MPLFDLLPPWPLLSAFLFASLVLAVTPGPGVLYILTRTLAQGRRVGLASVAGVGIGNFANAVFAAIGLAALFAVSALAFTVVKYAGAAYLIYLGLRALRTPATPAADAVQAPPASVARVFRDGLVVSLLNPKTTMFFAAFLPQFMTPGHGVIAQSIVLGGLFVGIAALTDSCYALAAGKLSPMLRSRAHARSAGRLVTGSAFIALGAFTALTGERHAK